EKIIRTYKSRENDEKYAHLASFEEIESNDFNLNIPRYVDTFEEEEPIDIIALSQEIVDLNQEISKTEQEFLSMLNQLAVTDDSREIIEATKRIFGE
ncbi:MAG: N-6 DNA methylase, partial [Lactococcus lactis]